MRESSFDSAPRIYLGSVVVMLVESNPLEADILAQVLTGFKVKRLCRCSAAAEAAERLKQDTPDLVVVGTVQGGAAEGFEFIRTMRRDKDEMLRTAPAILLTGHTLQADVMRARDCGANFVVAKPITPHVLYERIMWLIKDRRSFIFVDSYAGPDRRFQKLGPPPGIKGRRKDDVSLKVGEATEANMSQNEIDAFFQPKGALR
jgi:DNA-binding response OmpR family regulator